MKWFQVDKHRDVEFRGYVASLLSRRANVAMNSGKIDDAFRFSEHAMTLWESIPSEVLLGKPNEMYYKAICLLNRGEIEEQQGELVEAEAATLEAVELMRPLALDPLVKRTSEKERLVQSLLQLGISVAQQNRLEQAKEFYEESMDVAQQLVADNPRVPRYPRLLMSVRYSLAVTEMLRKDFDTADKLILENVSQLNSVIENGTEDKAAVHQQLANNFNFQYNIRSRSPNYSIDAAGDSIRNAVRNLEMVVEYRPDWTNAQVDLGRATANLAEHLLLKGENEQALEQFATSILLLQPIVDDQPGWGSPQHAIANSFFGLTNAYAKSGEYETALKHCRQAIKYFDGREFRVTLEEARLIGVLGDRGQGFTILRKFIDESATTSSELLFAAVKAMQIETSPSSDSNSIGKFRQLSMDALLKAFEISGMNRNEFLSQIQAQRPLQLLLDDLKARID